MSSHRAYAAVSRTPGLIVAAIYLLQQSGPVLAENIPDKVVRLEKETALQGNEIARLQEQISELIREVSTLHDALATLRNGTNPQRDAAVTGALATLRNRTFPQQDAAGNSFQGKYVAFGHARGAAPIVATASTEGEAKAIVVRECSFKSISCKIEIVDTSLNPKGCHAISFGPRNDEYYHSIKNDANQSSNLALSLCNSTNNDCVIAFHSC
jgi:hypothetical protein